MKKLIDSVRDIRAKVKRINRVLQSIPSLPVVASDIDDCRVDVDKALHKIKEFLNKPDFSVEPVDFTPYLHDVLAPNLLALSKSLGDLKEQMVGIDIGHERCLQYLNLYLQLQIDLPTIDDYALSGHYLVSGLEKVVDHHVFEKPIVAVIEVHGCPRMLSSSVCRHIKAIASEAIRNTVKHSLSSAVRVTIDFKDDSLSVAIEDNGQGFDLERVLKETKGKGLRNMRERALVVSGMIDIDSDYGQGCKISLFVPYPEVKDELVQQ